MQVRAVPNARLLFRHKETSLHNDKHTSTDLPLHSVQSFPPLVRASVAAAARPTPPAESRPRVALPVRHAPAYVPQLRMILLQELSLQLLHFFFYAASITVRASDILASYETFISAVSQRISCSAFSSYIRQLIRKGIKMMRHMKQYLSFMRGLIKGLNFACTEHSE